MNEALLPCPWCGDPVEGHVTEGTTFRWRKFTGCCTDGPEVRHDTTAVDKDAAEIDSERRAIAAWNRRAALAAQHGAVGERWPNVESAMEDPLFQRARAIMGTKNWFQDNSLRNVVNYVLAATGYALRAENAKLREDIAEMVRADADNAFSVLAAAPTEAKPAQDAVECDACHGAGRTGDQYFDSEKTCWKCDGAGAISAKKGTP